MRDATKYTLMREDCQGTTFVVAELNEADGLDVVLELLCRFLQGCGFSYVRNLDVEKQEDTK